MSFRLSINESNKKVFFQQNYDDIESDIIKVRNAFSENGVYEFYHTKFPYYGLFMPLFYHNSSFN